MTVRDLIYCDVFLKMTFFYEKMICLHVNYEAAVFSRACLWKRQRAVRFKQKEGGISLESERNQQKRKKHGRNMQQKIMNL